MSTFTLMVTDSAVVVDSIRPFATATQNFTLTVIAAVPTLSQWALILLVVCLAVAGLASIRRRAVAE